MGWNLPAFASRVRQVSCPDLIFCSALGIEVGVFDEQMANDFACTMLKQVIYYANVQPEQMISIHSLWLWCGNYTSMIDLIAIAAIAILSVIASIIAWEWSFYDDSWFWVLTTRRENDPALIDVHSAWSMTVQAEFWSRWLDVKMRTCADGLNIDGGMHTCVDRLCVDEGMHTCADWLDSVLMKMCMYALIHAWNNYVVTSECMRASNDSCPLVQCVRAFIDLIVKCSPVLTGRTCFACSLGCYT